MDDGYEIQVSIPIVNNEYFSRPPEYMTITTDGGGNCSLSTDNYSTTLNKQALINALEAL